MKIVIKIPEKVYREFKEGIDSIENTTIIHNAVYDGTVLPKGYGRLIDENELIDEIECEEIDGRYYDVIYAHSIYDASTIIEADKGEEK